MRVLITATRFHPHKGGLERFAGEVAERLSKKGHTVAVLTFGDYGQKKQEKLGKINILRMPSIALVKGTFPAPNILSKDYWKTLRAAREFKPDLVVTNTRFFLMSLLGCCIARLEKIPFIHIEHGNRHALHNNPLVVWISRLYDETVGRIIMKRAAEVIAISKKGVPFCKKLGAKKVSVIPNSVDSNRFRRNSVTRKSLGFKKDEFIILGGIARLVKEKGLHDLIMAVKGVKGSRLIIIGDGPERKHLENLAAENKINMKITGYMDSEEISKYLSVANAFVNPSYSEGLPTCVLEAGSAGLPVVATDVGGTNEIITSSELGWLVKPGIPDQIRKALLDIKNNRSTALKKGEALRKNIIKEFDWSRNIIKLEQKLTKYKKEKMSGRKK